MRLLKTLSIVAVAALCLYGCGGGGGEEEFESAFQGIWAGNWSAPSLTSTGTVSIIVSDDGTFTGTSHVDNGPSGGSVSGSIDANGLVTGTVQYQGQAASSISGTLGITNGTSLSGTLVQTISGTGHNVTYDLTLF